MAKIRQEINIIDGVAGGASGIVLGANGIIQIDKSQYNGTLTIYFEAQVSTAHAANTLTLRRIGTTTDDGSVSVASTGLVRTADIASSIPSTATEYGIFSSSTTVRIKSARVIIIQDTTTLTNTETQIEIGNASNTTTTTDTALTNPKYFKYTAANWDGTKTFYFESTFKSGTSKSAATMTLQESSSITAPSWSNVASSAVTTTGTTAKRVRSGAITLTDGNWYRAVMKAGNSKSGITVYNAKVIIDQLPPTKDGQSNRTSELNLKGGTGGAETEQAYGQSFTAGSSYDLNAISFELRKFGSPTDDVSISVYSGSITGTLLGTSNTISGTLLSTTSPANNGVVLVFSTPISITSGVKYYFQVNRSGARDTSNYYILIKSTASSLANGGMYSKTNNSWSSESTTDDLGFFTNDALVTKLEPQYLLANTLFAAGTGLQTFLTKWDSTEWDAGAGTITYYSQAEAADNSTSDVTIEQADGGGTVTNSTLTNIDNAQISSALTMPSSENLDTKATTNAGDVAAARILVAYVYSAAAPSVGGMGGYGMSMMGCGPL